MALVITIAQQKGGAGKTTLASNLASLWSMSRRVALLDIDPQRSLSRWLSLRRDNLPEAPAIAFSDASGWRLAGELERLSKEADVLIVDTPPQIDSDAARAIRAASLVLIPVQPSMPDLWAADGTLELAAKEHTPVAIMLNRSPAKSRLRTAVEKEIAASGLTLMASVLGSRSAYAQAFAQGMGVAEAQPKSLAAAEITSLAEEVERLAGAGQAEKGRSKRR